MQTKPKKLLPPEYLSTHMVSQNRIIVDYTFWIKLGSLKNGTEAYKAHTLSVQMETNGKCCFAKDYFQYQLN